MSDETNAATARSGDLNLTPRGELRGSFAIVYGFTIGIVWLLVSMATNYPHEPDVTPLMAPIAEGLYRLVVVLWWAGMIIASVCAVVFGGMIVIMHRSQVFREAMMPRAALLRRDGGGR